LHQGTAIEANFLNAGVKSAPGPGHQALDRAVHGCRRGKDAIMQALAAASIDIDSVMAGDGYFMHALVGDQLIERAAARKLGQRHLTEGFALEAKRQREDFVRDLFGGFVELGFGIAQLFGGCVNQAKLLDGFGDYLRQSFDIASALRVFDRRCRTSGRWATAANRGSG
jgi:hypothetical protein